MGVARDAAAPRTGARTDVVDSAADDWAPGATVAGKYRLERRLGEGASGVVMAARGPDGELVALKILHRALLRDRQLYKRFRREARILADLRGPHLVRILDFGETEDGLLFMALELVLGEPLDVLAAREKITPARAGELVRQICLALEVAHAAGVVHRDLKPSNVMVQQEGGADRVRVLDFGMAKALHGDPSSSLNALTEANMVFGTPEYMAPEQARGDDVDARSDVYAAGVILYELLAGVTPFHSASPIGVMTAHLTETPVPPSERAPLRDIPPALGAVSLHALAKAPAERYQSAAQLGQALGAALQNPRDVLSTMPPPSDDPALRDTDLHLELADSLRPTHPAGSLQRPPRTWLWIAIVAALLGIGVGIAVSLWGSA